MKRAIIDGVYVPDASQDDLNANVRFADNATYHRQVDQDDNYIDVIQPWIGNKPNPEFISAYPDRAKDHFTEDELKHY